MHFGAPIIFIHYGPANYLRWTLECARRTNPEKRVVLLGDQSNRKSARGHAEFVDFHDIGTGEKIAAFDRDFRVIQGERHRFTKLGGIETWLKFVFRRWFLIERFLARERIDSFWTFDSDTLLLASLASREARFSDVAATIQCRGECLNGWVGSADLVAGYTSCILDLFRDEKYLEAQRERLRTHAGLAFNEMDAFTEFRRRESIETWHGEVPICGEIFDDALAFNDGFEGASEKVLEKTAIKRLWTDGESIFAKQKESGQFVRMLTCNMSWMPDYMWRRIIGHKSNKNEFVELSVREPMGDRTLRQAKMAIFKMRRALRIG